MNRHVRMATVLPSKHPACSVSHTTSNSLPFYGTARPEAPQPHRSRERRVDGRVQDREESVRPPRIAAWGRFRNDGAPARNHGAIMPSKIMQPNAELGMNGQIGLPHR